MEWSGIKPQNVKGGWGILEYLAQSKNNTTFVKSNRKFKFIDDLSILEIINLLSIGMASYNYISFFVEIISQTIISLE